MLPFLGCKFYSFSSRNPRALVDDGVSFTNLWVFKIIYEVSDIISTGMSLALFIVACYYFLFYKAAEFVTILLPSENTDSGSNLYFGLKIIFLVTLSLKTLAVLLKIVEQSRADIFIMDWESLLYKK